LLLKSTLLHPDGSRGSEVLPCPDYPQAGAGQPGRKNNVRLVKIPAQSRAAVSPDPGKKRYLVKNTLPKIEIKLAHRMHFAKHASRIAYSASGPPLPALANRFRNHNLLRRLSANFALARSCLPNDFSSRRFLGTDQRKH
jgi:hypothetical protein